MVLKVANSERIRCGRQLVLASVKTGVAVDPKAEFVRQTLFGMALNVISRPVRTGGSDPQSLLKGFSGCVLEVRPSEGGSLVRKISPTPDQNSRLEAEQEKLIMLSHISVECGLFFVPKLLGSGINENGLAYYETEFVPSWGLDSRLPRLNPQEVDHIIRCLDSIIAVFSSSTPRFVDSVEGDSESSETPSSFIVGKFRETSMWLHDCAKQYSEALGLIGEYDRLIQQVDTKTDGRNSRQSFCHGDFALDNMLIDRAGKLYLIDPLVNRCESCLWDVSKVFQSTLGRWQQIKNEEFELDLPHKKVLVSSSPRVDLFNRSFARIMAQSYDLDTVTLYLSTTLARVVKYSKSSRQLCALLILTNEILHKYIDGRCDLNEPLDALRR